MKKYSQKIRFIICATLLFIISSLTLVFYYNHKTYAVQSVDLSAIPSDIQAALGAFDTPANPATPDNTCDGNQKPYQQPYEGGEFSWISSSAGSQYDGTAINPIAIPYGTKKINLLLNNLTFICHLATVGNVSYPYNASVNAANCSQTLPSPAIPPNAVSEACVSSIYVSNAKANIPGNFSCIVGQQSAIWYQPGTKFWFEDPSQPGNVAAPGCSISPTNPEGSFTFTADSPITQSETLTIQVTEIEVSQFGIGGSKTSYMCVAGDYPAPNQTLNPAQSGCKSSSTTINLYLTTTPPKDYAPCPPWGNSDNNGSEVPINTPNLKTPTSLPAASATSPSSVTVYTPTNYNLNSVTESGSNDTTTFTPNQSSSGSFTANYTKFFKDYPYDSEGVTANYTETYSATTYELESSSTTTLSCPSGSIVSIYGCLYPLPNGKFTPAQAISTTTTTYYYKKVSGPTTGTVSGSTTSVPSVPECYNRHFSISLTSATPYFLDSSNNRTVENPATVVYKPSVKVIFSANHGGKLINPYIVKGVNTTINAQYHNEIDPSKYYSYPYSCTSNPTLPIIYSNSSNSPGPSDPTTSYSITYSCPATIPSLSYGDVACFNIGVDPSSGTMNSAGSIQTAGQLYSLGPSCSQPLQAKPYIKVFGGDVLAGVSSSHIASCYNNIASIYGFNKGGSGQQGSGTTVADLATRPISGFVSGQNVLNMLDPLTFSNTQPPPSYGGNYGEGGNCGGIGYYTYAQELANNPPQGFTVQPAPSTIGVMTISPGTHDVYYANGNVTINGNIIFNDSGVSPSNVPSFELVVKGGNITIGNNVTELDGVYIDEGGTIMDHGSSINECNSSYTTDYYDHCSKPLIVKGSLIAHTINLYRSYGTYHLSSSSSNPTDPNASEQFIYSPLNWLTPGYSPAPIVQSITSLPPIVN